MRCCEYIYIDFNLPNIHASRRNNINFFFNHFICMYVIKPTHKLYSCHKSQHNPGNILSPYTPVTFKLIWLACSGFFFLIRLKFLVTRDRKSLTMNEKKRVNCYCNYPFALLVNDFDTVNRIVGWVSYYSNL